MPRPIVTPPRRNEEVRKLLAQCQTGRREVLRDRHILVHSGPRARIARVVHAMMGGRVQKRPEPARHAIHGLGVNPELVEQIRRKREA